MALNRSEWIWFGGKWVRWDEATVHVSTHALHYGSSAFEGIRTYETADGPAIFRLDPHIRRLFNSCKMMRMAMVEHSEEELRRLCVDIVSRNRHRSCYIRPIVFRGSGTLGLNPLSAPVELAIFTIEWGRYLGAEAIEEGVDAFISSWRRPPQGTMAPLGKIGGQYIANQFVSIEAQLNGYTEGIMLDHNGYVAEGAGENLFMVLDGEIITPPLATPLLEGVTRATVITLAQDLGIPVRFENMTRDMLYLCDELFMTGTAAEITPVRSVDRIPAGDGARGPITKRLQDEFFGIVSGKIEDRHHWLTRVPALETVAAGS